jgi:hypothetical protein
MRRPAFIEIEGKRYFWRDILELRCQQLREWRQAEQPALFELIDDYCLASQRSADGRYSEPTLFER